MLQCALVMSKNWIDTSQASDLQFAQSLYKDFLCKIKCCLKSEWEYLIFDYPVYELSVTITFFITLKWLIARKFVKDGLLINLQIILLFYRWCSLIAHPVLRCDHLRHWLEAYHMVYVSRFPVVNLVRTWSFYFMNWLRPDCVIRLRYKSLRPNNLKTFCWFCGFFQGAAFSGILAWTSACFA